MMPSSSEKIAHALRQRMRGEVLADERTLTRYATDMSMYRIRPLAVVVPQDVKDVAAAVNFAREAGVPLTPRGGGTGTAGSALDSCPSVVVTPTRATWSTATALQTADGIWRDRRMALPLEEDRSVDAAALSLFFLMVINPR